MVEFSHRHFPLLRLALPVRRHRPALARHDHSLRRSQLPHRLGLPFLQTLPRLTSVRTLAHPRLGVLPSTFNLQLSTFNQTAVVANYGISLSLVNWPDDCVCNTANYRPCHSPSPGERARISLVLGGWLLELSPRWPSARSGRAEVPQIVPYATPRNSRQPYATLPPPLCFFGRWSSAIASVTQRAGACRAVAPRRRVAVTQSQRKTPHGFPWGVL